MSVCYHKRSALAAHYNLPSKPQYKIQGARTIYTHDNPCHSQHIPHDRISSCVPLSCHTDRHLPKRPCQIPCPSAAPGHKDDGSSINSSAAVSEIPHTAEKPSPRTYAKAIPWE